MTRTISKLAKKLNINVESVRFYERQGLIEQPPKPLQGYRHYPDETVNRIHFIKHSQELGFTLNEIKSLLALNDHPCGQVQDLAETKLVMIKKKMKSLRRLEKALSALLLQCQSNQDDMCCPIIDSLKS